ncbi:MAG: hypothetical protein M3081_13005 [Gemmatimonadota bacterium]|nr:hypothetical protein [Gemmatimonadota bacterium]
MRINCLALAASIALAGCKDSTGTVTPGATRILVLNTFGQTGVTKLSVDALAPTHIDFGSAFDGATFTAANDSVLSASSSFSGDQLYIADLNTQTLNKYQLPAGSNPAGAAFVPNGIPGATNGRYIAALRNSGKLAQVKVQTGAAAVVTSIAGAGLCPTDVAFYNGSAWVSDANQRCASDFAVQGPGRILRVSLADATRDTILLGAAAVAPQRIIIVEQFAYVLSSGDFFSVSGAVAKANVATKQALSIVSLPTGVYGVTMTKGEDGLLYVSGAPNPPVGGLYSPRVYVIDPTTMTTVPPYSGTDHFRPLAKQDGTLARCSAATADATGRIYCVENGLTTSTLLLFTSSGTFISSAPSGTIASDIALR